MNKNNLPSYDYSIAINGLDNIPLRTTIEGVKIFLQSFHDDKTVESLIEEIKKGIPFKNKFATISCIIEKGKRLRKSQVYSNTLTTWTENVWPLIKIKELERNKPAVKHKHKTRRKK